MRGSGWLTVAALTACTPKASDEPAAPTPAQDPGEAVSEVDPSNASGPAAHGFEVEAVTMTAADGTKVFGDFYAVEQDKPRPLLLLFHQAGSNAGEYAPIAPRLQGLGYNALAIDQRSGADRWDRPNRTVDALGKSTSYLEAYPDLEAALAWGQAKGYPRILIWGSSYSAALVFKLASEHEGKVHAVLSFSPGEYIKGQDGVVAQWASKVSVPIFVTSASGDEVAAAAAILAAAPASTKRQHEPKVGVHGSSTLRDDMNAGGAADNWSAVEAFLRDVVP